MVMRGGEPFTSVFFREGKTWRERIYNGGTKPSCFACSPTQVRVERRGLSGHVHIVYQVTLGLLGTSAMETAMRTLDVRFRPVQERNEETPAGKKARAAPLAAKTWAAAQSADASGAGASATGDGAVIHPAQEALTLRAQLRSRYPGAMVRWDESRKGCLSAMRPGTAFPAGMDQARSAAKGACVFLTCRPKDTAWRCCAPARRMRGRTGPDGWRSRRRWQPCLRTRRRAKKAPERSCQRHWRP